MPETAATVPVPTAPVEGAVAPLDAVTFRWAAPPGAAAFDLRVASAADPSAVLAELPGLPTTEATLADALPAGDALWWVRQVGGPWSAPARFRAGTPADVEADRLRAEAERQAERARSRDARRAGDAAPGAPPPDPEWPYAEGEALPDAPAPGWSGVPGFGVAVRDEPPRASAPAPRPLGPLGGEVVDAAAVALRWTPVPGATGYTVELSPDARFGRDVLRLDVGDAGEVALAGLVPATGWKLLWRVRARTTEGATAWSRYGRFYPAGLDAVDRFRAALDTARLAERRQADHARRERERALDRIALHERPDAVTDDATTAAVVGMALAGIALGVITLVAAFVVP